MIAVMALTAGAAAVPPASATDRTAEVQIDGKVRTFWIHLPDGPAPQNGFPLILAFHGGGGRGGRMRSLTDFDTVADARRFITVYPDGIDRHWNDGRSTIKNPQDDVGFVSSLLDQVEQSYAVDPRRIYATGLSNGALFTERLGCDLSQRIAAIAPVAGTLPVDIASGCRPSRPVAVMQIDGTDDPIMPFAGGDVADFGGVGEGGKVLSVADTTAFWAKVDGCGAPGTAQSLPVVAPLDRTRIVRDIYSGCTPAGQVTALTVVHGGHAWPGGPQFARPAVIGWASQQIDATSAIADFFLSLPLR